MNRFTTFLAFILIITSTVISQPKIGKITGTVIDKKTNAPIEGADVVLFSSKDSSMVKGTSTDKNGTYIIDEVPPGRFYIKANLVGYNFALVSGILINRESKEVTIDPIRLGQGETTTEEIIVEGEKSLIEFRPDKRVFNVAKDLTSQGGTLIDLLRNVPSVSVDQDGNVSLRGGEGVKIMIDGRTSGLEGQNRNAILEQIPANQVESIELITNPSAKFEAEGSVGIINIVLKKNENKGMGYTGTLGLNMGTGDKYSGQFSLSLKNNKVNIYGNYGYNLRNMTTSGFNDIFYLSSSYLSETHRESSGRGRNKSHNAKLGLDYYFDKQNTLGFSVNYRNQDRTGSNKNINKEYDLSNNLISDYFSYSNDVDKGYTFDVNANYSLKFKNPQQSFIADLSYSRDKDDESEENFDTYITPVNNTPFKQNEMSNETRDGYTGKIDYAHPFTKDLKLEAGYKGNYNKRDNDFAIDTYDYSTNQFVRDNNQSNRFIYKELINAGYGILTQQLGNFGYSLGLRVEHTKINGELVTTSEFFDRNYIDFFPSASISQKISSSSEIQLSYARRINRPRQRQLNPFRSLMGSNNYTEGNPELNPEFTDAFELNYIYYFPWATITPSIFYRQTKDEITRQRTLLDSVSTLSTFVNLNKSKSYGGELIISSHPAKFINFSGTFSFYRTELDASNLQNAASNAANIWSARGMSNIILPADFSAQLSYFYHGKRVTPNGSIEPFQSFDMAVKKDLFDKKLSITLRATDIFNTAKFRFNFNDASFTESSERVRDSRGLFLNISYKFGREEKQKERRRKDNENNNNEENDIEY
jgi:outer membrane receptor protein involved in Fe transport